MLRYIIVLALAGLLAACTSQGGGQSSEPSASGQGVAASDSASGTSASGEPSAACAEAFEPIAELNLDSTSDLGDLPEVDATIESCESLADWMAGAQQVITNEVRPGAVDILLGLRCESGSLSRTPVCEDLANS